MRPRTSRVLPTSRQPARISPTRRRRKQQAAAAVSKAAAQQEKAAQKAATEQARAAKQAAAEQTRAAKAAEAEAKKLERQYEKVRNEILSVTAASFGAVAIRIFHLSGRRAIEAAVDLERFRHVSAGARRVAQGSQGGIAAPPRVLINRCSQFSVASRHSRPATCRIQSSRRCRTSAFTSPMHRAACGR